MMSIIHCNAANNEHWQFAWQQTPIANIFHNNQSLSEPNNNIDSFISESDIIPGVPRVRQLRVWLQLPLPVWPLLLHGLQQPAQPAILR